MSTAQISHASPLHPGHEKEATWITLRKVELMPVYDLGWSNWRVSDAWMG